MAEFSECLNSIFECLVKSFGIARKMGMASGNEKSIWYNFY